MECPTCKNENPEGAKFCLNCGAKLILSCAECGTELSVNAKFCHECGAQIAVSAPAIETILEGGKIVEAMQRLVPQEYADRLRESGGQLSRERRLVTILFSDVKGSTAMGESLDPEDVMEIMDGAFEVLIEPIYRYEGTLARLMGDAVLALFGAPISHENDPERAIRAGLEIVAGAKEYAAQLKEERNIGGFNVRVGINTGLVVVGEVGSDLRVEYTAMGDAINLAARMEQNAPEGGVLITHDTYRHVRGIFDIQPQEPITVKGKSEAMSTYLVERAKPRAFRIGTRGVEGIETRMVGRETELKSLQDALYAAVEDGEGQIITILGEAGVGKSRLLYEFTNWIDLLPQEVRFFQGRARQDTQNQPYALLRDMFSYRFLIQDGDSKSEVQTKVEIGFGEVFGQDESETMRAHFISQLLGFDFSGSPHLEGVLEDAQQLRDRSLIYLNEYIQGILEIRPTVIFLEDIHWADDSSLDVVNQLARNSPQSRFLIVCLARPVIFESRPHWGEGLDYHNCLDIKPLTKRDSRQLVDEILQRVERVPVELRDLVVKGAEGNPFYIEELIKMLLEDGVIVKDETHWKVELQKLSEVNIPSTLTGVLQARLDSLPQDERELLQQASVVGRIFWDRVLQYMVDQEADRVSRDGIDGTLSSIRGRELIFHREGSTFAEAHEYIFKHAILRDVTYESVLKRLRRVYHRLVAEWLIDQGDEYPGLIAVNYQHAHENDQASEWYLLAGDRAKSMAAPQEARKYYELASELNPPDNLERRWHILLGHNEVVGMLGDTEVRQTEDLELVEMANQFGDDNRMAVALMRKGHYESVTGDFQSAIDDLNKALVCARSAGDLELETLLCGLLVVSQTRSGKFDDASITAEKALELSLKVQDDETRARTLTNVSVLYAESGNVATAARLLEEQVQINSRMGNKVGEAIGYGNLGYDYVQLGLYDQGREALERSFKLSEEIGMQLEASYQKLNLALANCWSGNPDGGRIILESVIPGLKQIGDLFGAGAGFNYLGLCLECEGDRRAAIKAFLEAERLFREIGATSYAVDSMAGLVRIYQMLDRMEEASQYIDRVWGYLGEHGGVGMEFPLQSYLTCAEYYTSAGDPHSARKAVQVGYKELMAHADRIDVPEWRKSYLENVEAHRKLIEMWERQEVSN